MAYETIGRRFGPVLYGVAEPGTARLSQARLALAGMVWQGSQREATKHRS